MAPDAELHREVAPKWILDGHADDPASRQRFLLEAEITGGLEHPGIVPVYGLGTYDGGRPFYAMRPIRGETLEETIARFHDAEGPGRDPGERAWSLRGLLRRFVDVCNAVAYAHSLLDHELLLHHQGERLGLDGRRLVVHDPAVCQPDGDHAHGRRYALLRRRPGLRLRRPGADDPLGQLRGRRDGLCQGVWARGRPG